MLTSYIIFSCVLSANHLIKNVFHIVNLSRGYYINGAFESLQAGWEWNAFDRLEDGHLTNKNAKAGNKRLQERVGKDHPGFYRLATTFKSELEHVKNKVEQLEAGNLYPVRISRTVRAQKTRTKLKELLVNRQISLKKYATGQGQLNVVIKDKRARRQDTQADLRGIYFINIADALDIFTNFLNVALVCNFNFQVPWPLLQVQMVTKSQDVSVEQMEGG